MFFGDGLKWLLSRNEFGINYVMQDIERRSCRTIQSKNTINRVLPFIQKVSYL